MIGKLLDTKRLCRTIPRGLFAGSGVFLVLVITALAAGCGSAEKKKETRNEFFTSGSREADQRASQRMAKAEQLSGTGEGEKDVKKAKPAAEAAKEGEAPQPAQVEKKLALYDRLGSEKGITDIVDDFVTRALQDPRVNWERQGVKRGGFSFHRNDPVTWKATTEHVATLKKHMIQFLSLATGGPAQYDGKNLKPVHADMHITNSEFDAAVGDLKATLDRLKIPNAEQKELLAVIETTRPEIVTVR